MKHLKNSIFTLVTSTLLVGCGQVPTYQISLSDNNQIVVTAPDGSTLSYAPSFYILESDINPEKKLRRGDFGYVMDEGEDMGVLYQVPTWGKPDDFVLDPNIHVEDGFNPEQDRSYGEGRTANYYQAAKSTVVSAISATQVSSSEIVWEFATNDKFTLTATVTLSEEFEKLPELSYTFTPKQEAWYSVGFVGAPSCDPLACEEIWQAQIWQEKRFPTSPFLSESFRSSIPTTFVTNKGITNGVVGNPKYIPFDPIPTTLNSQFGVLVRSVKGEAQPSIFAPVLGNKDSKMEAGTPFTFSAFLYHKQANILDSYEWLARNICQFKDVRMNSTCNLNTTIENMTDYCMSPWAMFIDSLRGCNYSTDVPGAVKNISGLHPLEVSILTNDEAIFKRYARPMLEYGLSRERFLFSTNDKVKGQGTSSRLDGPGVPLSDLSTTYTYSGNKADYFLTDAKKLYDNKVVRSLNLDAIYYEERWQNALFLYNATGEQHYLDAAIVGADEYLEERVYTKQTDFKDKLSMGMFFWTSYTNQWMELLQLYYATGEQRYLDAAHEGARYYTQLCWMTPIIPEGTITVNKGGVVPKYRNNPSKFVYMNQPETEIEAWKVSEIGLTPESSGTAQGHRAIFMAHHAPFMLRIASLTGDDFLRDIARSAVIGRYESFPGYHINAGRTDAFEKIDFAHRSQAELNGHTSIHYNHPWSHLAMLWDYLFSDFYFVSGRKIDFPVEYAEGYAYCRSLIYGAKSGSFYGDKDVTIYMPQGLVQVSDLQQNYISGIGNGNLYVAFANQSKVGSQFEVTFDNEKAGIDPSKTYNVSLWKENVHAGTTVMDGGKLSLDIKPQGITAIVIEGVEVEASFIDRFGKSDQEWSKNYTSVDFENDRAVYLDFGTDLRSVYVWNESNNSKYKSTKLHYAIDGGEWQVINKVGYPYEYAIEMPNEAATFEYYFEARGVNGKSVKSDKGILEK